MRLLCGSQEAGTRAIEADEQQRQADAVKLYKKALEIISEGLALNVPSSGLSAKVDNVANWKQQLGSWQSGIQERCDWYCTMGASVLLAGCGQQQLMWQAVVSSSRCGRLY